MGPIPFRVWRNFVGVQLFSSGSLGLRLLRFFMLEGFGVLRFRLVWIRVPGTGLRFGHKRICWSPVETV